MSESSWPAGFYYGYDLACDGVGQNCHTTCRTGTTGRQTTDCPPPPVGTGWSNYGYLVECTDEGVCF